MLARPPRLLSFFLCLTLLAMMAGAYAETPNVIVILTDDQGYGDMSCHGNPWLQTPHLDRLHNESVSLENFHTDPYCTPTRAALLTGRYSTRTGAWSVTQGRQLLKHTETTMADVFSEAGYRTGMFGKWHLGDTYPYAPHYRGFDETVCHKAGGLDEIGNPLDNDYFDDIYFRNGKPERFTGYCTDVFFNETQRFIRAAADANEPFFVYLPLNAMHSPFTVAESYAAPFRAHGHPDKRARFFGMIVNFDENLGRLLHTLETLEVKDNTVIIFLGDNGTAEGFTPPDGTDMVGQQSPGTTLQAAAVNPATGFNDGRRGKKGRVYDGGHRVACFIHWPTGLPQGQSVNRLTTHHDLLPTLIEICDLNPTTNLQLDGDSLIPLMTQDNPVWPERLRFVDRQRSQLEPGRLDPKKYSPPFAVMSDRWRLVRHELYDIQADPSQLQDVAAEHPKVAQDLYNAYLEWFQDVTTDNGEYTPFFLGTTQEPVTTFTCRDWHPTDGTVMWENSKLNDDSLWGNGFWAIQAAKAGRYRIELSRFPLASPGPMKAVRALLKVGEQTWEQTLKPSATHAAFEIELPNETTLLQTWLTDEATGKQRGAYFVTCRRLPSSP